MQAALTFFVEQAGIGPWFLAESMTLVNCRSLGHVCDIELSIALANSGGLQFELIQQLNDVPSNYRNWRARYPGRLLVQHFSSWSERYVEFTRLPSRAASRPSSRVGLPTARMFISRIRTSPTFSTK